MKASEANADLQKRVGDLQVSLREAEAVVHPRSAVGSPSREDNCSEEDEVLDALVSEVELWELRELERTAHTALADAQQAEESKEKLKAELEAARATCVQLQGEAQAARQEAETELQAAAAAADSSRQYEDQLQEAQATIASAAEAQAALEARLQASEERCQALAAEAATLRLSVAELESGAEAGEEDRVLHEILAEVELTELRDLERRAHLGLLTAADSATGPSDVVSRLEASNRHLSEVHTECTALCLLLRELYLS